MTPAALKRDLTSVSWSAPEPSKVCAGAKCLPAPRGESPGVPFATGWHSRSWASLLPPDLHPDSDSLHNRDPHLSDHPQKEPLASTMNLPWSAAMAQESDTGES